MLEAIARGKLTDEKIPEDAITSSVFSPLRALPPETIWRVVGDAMISREAYPNVLGRFTGEPPIHVGIELWPWLRGEKSVEPDVLITVEFPDGKRLAVLVEVKWNAPLGFDQISHQRDALAADHSRQAYSHRLNLLLVRSRAQADAGRDPCINEIENQVVICTWAEFAHRLAMLELIDQEPMLKGWKDMLIRALRRTEGTPFSHFSIEAVLDPNDRSCLDWQPAGMVFPPPIEAITRIQS